MIFQYKSSKRLLREDAYGEEICARLIPRLYSQAVQYNKTHLKYTSYRQGKTRSVCDDEELADLHGEGDGGADRHLQHGRQQLLRRQPLQVVEALQT